MLRFVTILVAMVMMMMLKRLSTSSQCVYVTFLSVVSLSYVTFLSVHFLSHVTSLSVFSLSRFYLSEPVFCLVSLLVGHVTLDKYWYWLWVLVNLYVCMFGHVCVSLCVSCRYWCSRVYACVYVLVCFRVCVLYVSVCVRVSTHKTMLIETDKSV